MTGGSVRSQDEVSPVSKSSAKISGRPLTTRMLFASRASSQLTHAPPVPITSCNVRLDLLVETVLPEDESVELEAISSTVEADVDLLAPAVRNLIENARLHGEGEVRVRVEGSTVTVKDDGPGLSKRCGRRPRRRSSRGGRALDRVSG